MPGIKRKRPTFKRTRRRGPARKLRQRRRAYARRVFRRPRISRQLGTIIPNRVFCKFRAADVWIPATSPSGGYVQLYANNVYDPKVGISTTKCSGVTQMMSIYEFGIVNACKVTVKCLSNTVNSMFYIMWSDSTTSLPAAAPSHNFMLECPKDIRYRHCAVYQYNERPPTIKSYKKIKYLEKKRELEPNDYKFTSSAGPAKACGVQIGYIPVNAANATTYLNELFIRITYYCKLYERKTATIAE